jgi:hypothetical protein
MRHLYSKFAEWAVGCVGGLENSDEEITDESFGMIMARSLMLTASRFASCEHPDMYSPALPISEALYERESD